MQINGMDVPNGQVDGKIVIIADASATPGTHALQIVTRMNFNGNGLEMQRTLNLVVEAVGTRLKPLTLSRIREGSSQRDQKQKRDFL